MENKDLEIMSQIMTGKDREMEAGLPPLDPEGRHLAGQKRKTFDLPTNAVKVDPLR